MVVSFVTFGVNRLSPK